MDSSLLIVRILQIFAMYSLSTPMPISGFGAALSLNQGIQKKNSMVKNTKSAFVTQILFFFLTLPSTIYFSESSESSSINPTQVSQLHLLERQGEVCLLLLTGNEVYSALGDNVLIHKRSLEQCLKLNQDSVKSGYYHHCNYCPALR